MDFSLNNHWIEMAPSMRAAVDQMGPYSRHALFHKCCQTVYEAQGGTAADPDSVLRKVGYTTCRNLIDPKDIADFQAIIEMSMAREAEPFKPTSETPGYNALLTDQEKPRAAQILYKAFRGQVEKQLFGYFGSNFMIRSATVGRLYPSAESTISYLWHRDAEIPQQVHVILYLTDLSDDRGSTDLLSLEDTKIAAIHGYDFPLIPERRSDLSDIFEKAGRPYTPYRVEAKAGDALVFCPNRVLHRGIQPIAGFRDAILCVVLPCPSPWDLTLQHNFPSVFIQKHYMTANMDPFAYYANTLDAKGMPSWVREFKFGPDNWQDAASE